MKLRKLTALAMSAVMVTSSIPFNTFATESSMQILSEDDTLTSQTSSLPELIYPNEYNVSERTQNFDKNWRFSMGNLEGASEKGFNDSSWRELDLPHDYSIEQEYSNRMEAESGYLPGGSAWYRKKFTLPAEASNKRVRIDFDGVYMNATVYVNGHKLGTHAYGYTPFSFDITKYLDFNSENVIAVKVDHKTPSSRWYSGSGIYRSVKLTVTDAVHVDLWGTKVNTPDLNTNTANPKVEIRTKVKNDSEETKAVKIVNTIYDDADTELASVTSEEVSLAAGENKEVKLETNVSSPRLWSVDDPNLYTVKTEVKVGEEVVDTYYTDFGFRYFNFDTNSGFSLNGTNVKLKGVCMHHDQGALGAVANKNAIRRQVEILKEMGCNSIRVTHNPAAKELLEVCDELGVLVIDEAFDGWHRMKNGNTNDYSKHFNANIEGDNEIIGKTSGMKWYQYDLSAMINSAYNSPSVIMWSLGNEVLEGTANDWDSSFVEVSGNLAELAHSLDESRPSTIGDNKIKGQTRNPNNLYAQIDQKVADVGGVVGLNYANGGQYDAWHRLKPDWKLYASETVSSISSRGIYKIKGYTGSQNASKQLTAYDKSRVGWGAFASEGWFETIKRDYLAGEYVWTGFDYIGEPTPYNGTDAGAKSSWPSPKSSYFGIIDTAGFPKDSYYLYRSLWNDENTTLHILPAWNENVVEKDRQGNVPVVVYSNAKSVELFFKPANGVEQSLGLKKFTTKNSNTSLYQYQIYEGEGKSSTEHENLYMTWSVPYADGTLRAVAYSDENGQTAINETVGRNSVTTTKEARKLVVKKYNAEGNIFADGYDLAYFEVDVVDADGNIVPDAQNDISFEVSGEGKLVGLDNGNPVDHTSHKANHRNAFSGKALAIVQTSETAGSITLKATSAGLEGTTVTINTERAETGNSGNTTGVKSYYMSKNYYVKKGHYPILPEKIKVNYNNDTSVEENVVWDSISDEQINKIGAFEVKGKLPSGKDVIVNINMIDKVAALLNYSTTTPIGVKPILPESRPAVLENGEVLKVGFPVTWEAVEDSRYNTEGIVKVAGKAEVFGENLKVEADVRVQKENIALGNSISKQALTLKQDVGNFTGSDTLDAIKDGLKDADPNTAGGPNPSLWSNWTAAQGGRTSASLTFEYATQQRLGQVVVYFAKDNSSLRYPDANTTVIEVSEDGSAWTKLETVETIGEDEYSQNVKEYTYDFNPVTFTFVRLTVKNSTNDTGMTRKPSVGITEVELKPATGSYTTNRTAQLSKLEINGISYSSEVINSGKVSNQALFVDTINMETKDNASATFIPNAEGEKKAYLVVESEDHLTRKKTEIILDADEAAETAEDPSRDYPREKTNVEVGSEQIPQDMAANAVDGNTSTLWHTEWRLYAQLEHRWISLGMEEENTVDGIRYFARGGEANGRVREYKIYVSSDAQEWKEVAHGTWENEQGWKQASFDPVSAKYVKLEGVHTYGSGGQQDRFMSAGELRIKLAKDTINIADENSGVKAQVENSRYIVDELKTPVKAKVEVTKDGTALKYGLDYRIKYENNNKIGTAYAVVEGIVKYSGKIKVPFKIMSKSAREVFVEDGEIISAAGEQMQASSASFEKGTQLSVRANEKEGMTFKYWRVMPEALEIADKNNAEISFVMPEYSVRLVAVYSKDDKIVNDVYTKTNPSTWYANADKEDLQTIFEAVVADNEEAALRLELTKTDKNTLKASSSDAVEDMETGFFINSKLVKETVENQNRKETEIEEAKTVRVTVEVPKKDRNMADYKVVSYKKLEDGVSVDVVDSVEKDGFISFMLSTDSVYGVFYKKAYEVVFEDYDGTELSRQYVEIGNMPEIPEVPERKNYVFAGWDKEVVPATSNRKYKALYTVSSEQLEASRARLRAEVEKVRQEFGNKENEYTKQSFAKLERELVKAETLVEESNSVTKLENQIQAIRKAVSELVKANQNSNQNSNANQNSNSNQNQNSNSGSGSGNYGGSRRGSSGGSGSSGRGGSGGSGGRVKKTAEKTENTKYVKITGTWQKSGNKWKLVQGNEAVKNTWAYKEVNGVKTWYIFDENGEMRTGWYKNASGAWYYLSAEANESEGEMQTGWKWIKAADGKEKCYYLNADGSLAVNTQAEGKYNVNSDGAWVVNGVEQTK